MKLKTSTVILIVAVIIGLSLLLYPTVADYWNSNYVSHALTDYTVAMEALEEEDYQEIWEAAIAYNDDLRSNPQGFTLTPEMRQRYFECLDVTGSGLMGHIEIGKIGLTLPLYHDTSNKVLASSIGHITWSSLPTGGPGTHCVVSGHRGLPNAKLFTDLDQLREGDEFTLSILDEVLTYEVDQIRIVLPTEMSELTIEEGKDYCTLVTCTPYGINTHRLLVRGHRVETVGPVVRVISEAVLVDQLLVAVFLSIPILFLLLMAVMLKKPPKKLTLEQILSSQKSEEGK